MSLEYTSRLMESVWRVNFRKPFVHLVFGARQTGKSTLILQILPKDALIINLADPRERNILALRPGSLIDRCHALPPRSDPYTIFIDEAQNLPEVFDSVQVLYEGDPQKYRFILCGSSARKLRASGTNRLPGRSLMHNLFPLSTLEYQSADSHPLNPILDFLEIPVTDLPLPFPKRSLEDRMVFGDLPGITKVSNLEDRGMILESYTNAHLEEEIRRETIIKDWTPFLRFLRFSARESGKIINIHNISKETGISGPTIKSYYQLLEDMYQGFSVPAWSGSSRKSTLSSSRFFFFDNGVRNAAAAFPLTLDLVNIDPGSLFEHFVGTNLYRLTQLHRQNQLLYWRTADGAEIDFILERSGKLLPIEVKWTEAPTIKDARHLINFIKENDNLCTQGILICRCPFPLALSENIIALPWWAV